MSLHKRHIIPIIIVPVLVGAAIWYAGRSAAVEETGWLRASGMVEAVEINVASEISGRIKTMYIENGSRVERGEPLFELDVELLQAQRQRAVEAVAAAEAGVRAASAGVDASNAALGMAQSAVTGAEAGLEAARIQNEMAVRASRLAEAQARTASWTPTGAGSIDSLWYFDRAERLTAAGREYEAASAGLETAQADFKTAVEIAGTPAVLDAEKELAEAQAAFLVAADMLSHTGQTTRPDLREAVQESYEAAREDLEEAEEAYRLLLDDYPDVKAARAGLVVARERLETAMDHWIMLQTGQDALTTAAAATGIKLAESAVAQAQTAVEQAAAGVRQAEGRLEQARIQVQQARAELNLIDLQLRKMVVYAPSAGVVTAKYVQPGEFLLNGVAALRIGQLDHLTITVFLPEDRYGQVKLGEEAAVAVDSFPDLVFSAQITRIADKAEYTPRNVQTEEGRRTTVFAVELAVEDSQGRLKPGMPADVAFIR
jgi:HlyD family secretion protein